MPIFLGAVEGEVVHVEVRGEVAACGGVVALRRLHACAASTKVVKWVSEATARRLPAVAMPVGRSSVRSKTESASVVVTLNGATDATVKVGGINEDTIRNIENVTGGSAADKLTGNGLSNTFRGGLGADILNGGAGRDTFHGGAGFDTIRTSVAGQNL